MAKEIIEAARFFAVLGLVMLPGAWLAFGLPLRQVAFHARVALSGVLSPIVVAVEFYLVRWVGFSFSQTVVLLLILNAASAVFLVREWRKTGATPRKWISWSLAGNALVFLFLAFCISVPWFSNHTLRMFNFHVWMHLSIVNQFPRGTLVPEEPELAGVQLAYPWIGHVYWAVLSKAAGWPFTKIYVLTNLAFLLWTCILVYEACKLLGAPPAGRRSALIWLTLGTNVIGFWIWKLTNHLPGDIRYTPWIRKFMICELSAFWIGMFSALMVIGLVALRTRSHLMFVMASLLTMSIGLVYPPILPAAFGFAGALVLVLYFDPRIAAGKSGRREAVWFTAELIVAVFVSLLFVKYVAAARAAPPVTLSNASAIFAKVGTGIIAITPFLLGIACVPRRRWVHSDVVVLLAGAALCFLIRPIFRISAGYNEYKLMFPTALFLVPVASLAIAKWNLRRISPEWFVLASALLLSPMITANNYHWELEKENSFARVEESGSRLVLAKEEPEAGWIAAVVDGTSPNTILAIHHSEIFLPALLERSLLAPPEQKSAPPGYWLMSRYNLLEERGYQENLVNQRQDVLLHLFENDGNTNSENLLSRLKEFRRPVAIVFTSGDGRGFRSWLERERQGRMIYRDSGGTSVWLLEPDQLANNSLQTSE
jgi:hypothetical protein